MGMENFLLKTDSYKLSHYRLYPPKTEYVGSYFEAREGGEYRENVFFGLQYQLERHFTGQQVTQEAIKEAHDFSKEHFGSDLFNTKGWEYILDKHDGRLPISIRAVPEGSVVPESNVLMTIQNTDPNCAWLTNHCETLLVELWYPSTVATISRSMKKALLDALRASGNPAGIDFMLHDFGFRGSTSFESAALGGAAHLVNFQGSDTIAGIRLLQEYYNADVAGFSVPAAEHSTVTSWGKENEAEAYRHALRMYPEGIVSIVSDSWDIINACSNIWGEELRAEVQMNPQRRVVIRPDSGDPEGIIPLVLETLGGKFGYQTNHKGYKLLPPYLRVLQGDGISRRSLPKLLTTILESGWSAENMVFGSGGGLLQDCNRDTLRYAMKCSWAMSDGRYRRVSKNPSTDSGKASKSGQLKLVRDTKGYRTVSRGDQGEDLLEEVFRDGEITKYYGLGSIRRRAAEGL